jgi:hypothetical protein
VRLPSHPSSLTCIDTTESRYLAAGNTYRKGCKRTSEAISFVEGSVIEPRNSVFLPIRLAMQLCLFHRWTRTKSSFSLATDITSPAHPIMAFQCRRFFVGRLCCNLPVGIADQGGPRAVLSCCSSKPL